MPYLIHLSRCAVVTAVLLILVASPGFARQTQPSSAMPTMESLHPATPSVERMRGNQQHKALAAKSLVSNVPFRTVGPTVMSGRVVDLAVNPEDPAWFYAAYASGGLWKTTNNGQSFEPLFQDHAVMTLGDIAVDWNGNETVWIGTGENNSSRSSYAGNGVYKSTDGGATWQHMGLEETHRTGRIILHPEDPNTVWVAAIGHLYSPNSERGVYKTTDGGRSWLQVLFVDDNTGAIDLVMEPGNPSVLYATMWHRERRAWNFVESGPGSGIYKSTDGGETWTLLSTEGSGFPTGEWVGRIGVDVYPGNPNVVYAFLDNQDRRPEEEDEEEQPALTMDLLETMPRTTFLEVSEEDVETFLRDNFFPDKYTGASVREMIETEEIEPRALYDYLNDANQQLFDTPVIGAEVYRSEDGGQTWQRTHDDFLNSVYSSYGYYFGEIRVAPDTPDRIYILGVPILMSEDAGKTFKSIGGPSVHSDHHALWLNPNRPHHLINGNDGGVNITYDDGETWFKGNTPTVGQFYAIQVDEAKPYNVYGGLQDNGVWYGPSTYEASVGWHARGNYPYDFIAGGDGMQVEVDTRTNTLVYTGSQFGFYGRYNTHTGQRMSIRPRHELGEPPLRFNWQTPIHLSRHNQDILYMGANRLYRSLNQGEDLQPISEDLTHGGQQGDVPYGTLATIDESPLRFGLLYTGSDDGYIHVTRDGGHSWSRISDALPQNLWVSRVEASNHEEGRVYATLNGYRWDHFDAYVYRSDDFGATWQRLGTDLPEEPVNVIIEDPSNEDVLFVGTDHGLYVSLDRGQTFMAMDGELPRAPVHDLKIQAQEKDLVVGTHGRSIYVASIEQVQQLTPALLAEALHVFDIEEVTHTERWGNRSASWRAFPEPEITIPFYSAEAGTVTINVKTEEGGRLHGFTHDAVKGLNYATYDLTVDAMAAASYNEGADEEDEEFMEMKEADNGQYYLVHGTYTVAIVRGAETVDGTLKVNAPRR